MKKIAWVTDSTAHLDEELLQNEDVYVVPILILLDGQQYKEGVDLTAQELFDKLKTVKDVPKTSQPSIGQFKDLYEQLEKDYDAVIAIHVSSKLSGTFSTSKQAADLVNIPVYSIDSKVISYPLTYLIKEGIKLHEDNKSIEEIVTSLNDLLEKNELYVLVGNLEQLQRSGRLTGLQFLLGSMLNVKPIITLENGLLKIKEKVRSERRARQRLINYVEKAVQRNRLKEIFLLYSLHEKDALYWKEELQKRFPDINYFTYPLCAAIGLHTGETTLAISWYNNN